MNDLSPPTLEPKWFQVFWSDNDRPVSDYRYVTGSSRDGNVLMLVSASGTMLVNFDEVRLVVIVDESPSK